jgi:hypothetical protein
VASRTINCFVDGEHVREVAVDLRGGNVVSLAGAVSLPRWSRRSSKYGSGAIADEIGVEAAVHRDREPEWLLPVGALSSNPTVDVAKRNAVLTQRLEEGTHVLSAEVGRYRDLRPNEAVRSFEQQLTAEGFEPQHAVLQAAAMTCADKDDRVCEQGTVPQPVTEIPCLDRLIIGQLEGRPPSVVTVRTTGDLSMAGEEHDLVGEGGRGERGGKLPLGRADADGGGLAEELDERLDEWGVAVDLVDPPVNVQAHADTLTSHTDRILWSRLNLVELMLKQVSVAPETLSAPAGERARGVLRRVGGGCRAATTVRRPRQSERR